MNSKKNSSSLWTDDASSFPGCDTGTLNERGLSRFVEELTTYGDSPHLWDTGTLNERWARRIIEELIHHGVQRFFIAPGSRSTPLTVAAASASLVPPVVHLDERGLAFHALGYAKGSKEPVALIVTSGSAVGNLLPAVMESHYDHVPLILLTADLPPEHKDTGANQEANQQRIFLNFVRWECSFPCPDPHISEAFIGTTLAQGLSYALSEPKGPVHLNCMFRKPFLGKQLISSSVSNQSSSSPQTQIFVGQPHLDERIYKSVIQQLCIREKGVILIGQTACIEDYSTLYDLSSLLGWPIFADVLSCLRTNGWMEGLIPFYDLVLITVKTSEAFRPDAILQLGDRFVSSTLPEWIASKCPRIYCQVAPHLQRKDPISCVTHRITTDLDTFLRNMCNCVKKQESSQWRAKWQELNFIAYKKTVSYFQPRALISEPHLFHYLTHLPLPATAFFFSNSMCIRNANLFFFPKVPCGPVHGNRGNSGIDGNLATIAGIAKGINKPMIACVGDLTFLHDLTSLILFSSDLCVKLIVINNNGGDVFSFLPISQHKDPHLVETYFRVPHAIPIKQAASLFGIPYENPQTIADFEKIILSPGTILIEIKTQPGESRKIHEEILMDLDRMFKNVI